MTDFLSSLIERSFGTAPAIRPRLSSLFEPVSSPASSGPIARELPSRDLVDRAGEQVIIAVDRPPSSPRATPLHEDVFSANTRGPSSHISSPSDRAIEVKPATVSAATREIAPEPKTDHRVVARDLTHEQGIAVPERTEFGIAHVTSAPADASQRHPERQPTVPPSEEPGITAVDDRALVVPSRAATRVAADLQQTAAAWHGTTRHRGDARSSATLLQAPSERDVHVSIGRVEVRAVSSERKAPPRERSTSPVMSLDTYLHRQARRGAE